MTPNQTPEDNPPQRVRRPKFIYSRGSEPDPEYTLANERTFLSWIRTGLAFIAGGIVLNAFAVDMAVDTRKTLSILLLGIGSIISLWAWISWARVERSVRERTPLKNSPALALLSGTVVAAAVIVAIAFL
jgi:putative membrane protein